MWSLCQNNFTQGERLPKTAEHFLQFGERMFLFSPNVVIISQYSFSPRRILSVITNSSFTLVNIKGVIIFFPWNMFLFLRPMKRQTSQHHPHHVRNRCNSCCVKLPVLCLLWLRSAIQINILYFLMMYTGRWVMVSVELHLLSQACFSFEALPRSPSGCPH